MQPLLMQCGPAECTCAAAWCGCGGRACMHEQHAFSCMHEQHALSCMHEQWPAGCCKTCAGPLCLRTVTAHAGPAVCRMDTSPQHFPQTGYYVGEATNDGALLADLLAVSCLAGGEPVRAGWLAGCLVAQWVLGPLRLLREDLAPPRSSTFPSVPALPFPPRCLACFSPLQGSSTPSSASLGGPGRRGRRWRAAAACGTWPWRRLCRASPTPTCRLGSRRFGSGRPTCRQNARTGGWGAGRCGDGGGGWVGGWVKRGGSGTQRLWAVPRITTTWPGSARRPAESGATCGQWRASLAEI